MDVSNLEYSELYARYVMMSSALYQLIKNNGGCLKIRLSEDDKNAFKMSYDQKNEIISFTLINEVTKIVQ